MMDKRITCGLKIQELCAAVSRTSQKRVQSKMIAMGLSAAAYNLINVISDRQNMTLTEAAKTLRVETASLSSLAVRLERDGFLQRIPSAKDKRTQLLKLTDSAKKIKFQAAEIMAIEATDLTHNLSQAEQDQLIAVLQRVLSNIEPTT